MTENRLLPVLVFIAVLLAAVLLVSGCAPLRWLGILPERPAVATDDAPDAEAGDGPSFPFPWDWVLGVGLVAGAAFTAATIWFPSFRDEIVGGALAIIAVKVGLALSHEVWASKWEILITVAVMAGGATAWNVGRKWWAKKSKAEPPSDSPPSPPPAS